MRFVTSNVVRILAAATAASSTTTLFVSGTSGFVDTLAHPSLSKSSGGDPGDPEASDSWTSSDIGRLLKPLEANEMTTAAFTAAMTTTAHEQPCPFRTPHGVAGSRRLLTGSPAIISNGVIKLGVNPFGNLNVPGTIPVYNGIETRVGLRFITQTPGGPLESEATSFGCECEVRLLGSFNPGIHLFLHREAIAQCTPSLYDALTNSSIPLSLSVTTGMGCSSRRISCMGQRRESRISCGNPRKFLEYC